MHFEDIVIELNRGTDNILTLSLMCIIVLRELAHKA